MVCEKDGHCHEAFSSILSLKAVFIGITAIVILKVMKHADTVIPVKSWDKRNALGMLGMSLNNN